MEIQENDFVKVYWPEVQNYMIYDDFNDNASVDTKDDQSYFINKLWKTHIDNKL